MDLAIAAVLILLVAIVLALVVIKLDPNFKEALLPDLFDSTGWEPADE